ncbi:unnamed protein product [Linum trigynum]|uniref:Uncharacterized protein n=1 Tax=Linum trigynum TaxID=586398 RepID=A0AAV2CST9_9ROSI
MSTLPSEFPHVSRNKSPIVSIRLGGISTAGLGGGRETVSTVLLGLVPTDRNSSLGRNGDISFLEETRI